MTAIQPAFDARAAARTFYDLLSNPLSDESAAAFRAATSEAWTSIGDYSGTEKSRDAFLAQVNGFGRLIPDLRWNIEDMMQDGERVIVRGRATGTPVGPMFGVDCQGRGFDIMSIDIHTLQDGRIVRTHHVEDWAGALRQLSGR